MRTGTLRALLRELRAGGVSEYRSTDAKGTTTIKLGVAVESLASAKSASAKAATRSEAERARSWEAFCAQNGLDPAHVAEATRDVS